MTQPAQQQDPNSEPNAVEVLGNVLAGIGQLFSSIQGWIQSGAGMLTLLSVFMLGAGGIIGHFSGALFGAPSSSQVIMIKGAQITKTINKGNPNTGNDDYLVYIKFPDPRGKSDCDDHCKSAVSLVTEGRGCLSGMCTAELKNTDQPDLKSGAASHFQNKLQAIEGSTTMTVDLVVSGSRVNADSAYPNILLVDEPKMVVQPQQ